LLLALFPLACNRASAQPFHTQPPRIAEFVEAQYPVGAEGAATVELELTIAATGEVTSVAVVPGDTDPAFNGAALEAARRLRFEPATRNGEPVGARIRFRYEFLARTAEPAAEPSDDTRVTPNNETPEPEFSATATATPPPAHVRRTIAGDTLTTMPGTRGDALRVIEFLPGVGRPPLGAGLVLLRGSAARESQAYFDGVAVPFLYHFGGLTSFVHSRLIEEIDLYPGNYAVRYGRRNGGIIEVASRAPAQDAFHGVIDVNLLDASLLVEGPLTDDVAVVAAARRSYVDFFFEEVVPSSAFDVVAAPVYYDYQVLARYEPSDDHELRFAAFGSSDDLALIFAEPSETDPAVRGNLEVASEFHRFAVSWTSRLSDSVDQEIAFSAGPTDLRFGLGDAIAFDSSAVHIQGRAEWTARLSSRVRLTAGFDVLVSPFEATYHGPAPRQGEGDATARNPLTSEPTVDAHVSGLELQPAVYAETDLRVAPPLRVVLGLRLDHYHELGQWSFDPRLTAIYALTDETHLRAGVGMFSQPPAVQEWAEGLGNRKLAIPRALHLGVGIEHELALGLSLTAEVFYKELYDRVVRTEGGVPPYFVNGGTGRAYGLELSGLLPVRDRRFFGFVSYTLSRSERRDGSGPLVPFDFDQTHILSLVAGYRLGRGWEIGGAFRLVSGNPLTPITDGVYDANHDTYVPIYGEVNSRRNPWFHRLDLRIEKRWDLGDVRLAVHLDVQNVYNATNPEGEIFNYDFRRSVDLPGLPILPSLGVRGEL